MSNLVNHAKRELELAGWPMQPRAEEGEFDYEYEIAAGVISLVQLFADQGHSGMSASFTTGMLNQLLQFNALTPLTDDPDEWQNVHDNCYQSRRQSDSFSLDGGKTYYRLDEKREWLWKLVRPLPKRLYFWLWNNHTNLFYPMHKSAHKSLDTVAAVA